MTRASKLLVVALMFLAMPGIARANVTWDWSIANASGQLVTTGSNYLAGTFTLVDFSVTSTTSAAALGSITGGQYSASGFVTTAPYDMIWDGSAVTLWDSAGSNTFDWWVFDDLSGPGFIFFGWETGNINTVNHGAYYEDPCCSSISSTLTVTPASTTVPEPASLALLGLGFAGLAFLRGRKQ